jgi:hypothetical protein
MLPRETRQRACNESRNEPCSLSDVFHSLEELHARKVDFVSVTERLEPAGRALAGMPGILDGIQNKSRADLILLSTKTVAVRAPWFRGQAASVTDNLH